MTLADLHNASQDLPERTLFEATVARDVTDIGEAAQVLLDDFPDHLEGPCAWSPVAREDGLYFPKAGDPCLVGRLAGAYIAQWEPKATEPDEEISGGGDFQPLDSDLTAIAALSTTSFGRAFLALADAAASRTYIGAAASAHSHAQSDITNLITDLSAKQPLDSDLTAIAALTTTSYGRSVLALADVAAARTLFGLVIGTDVQAFDADLSALAALTSAANKGIQFTGSGTAGTYDLTTAGKALLDDADATAQRTTLGLGSLAVLSAINGGNWSGTDLAVADGGTGASDASGARTNLGAAASSHTHAQSDITSLTSDLALKAPLASPALTGNPTAPTPTAGDNDTSIATTAFVNTNAAGGIPALGYHVIDQIRAYATGLGVVTTTATLFSGAGVLAASATAQSPSIFYFDPTDYPTWGSLTQKLRLKVYLGTNATAPGITITLGLYPVSAVAGGAGLQSYTLGTVTSGSTVAFTTPAASTRSQGTSGDFNAPSAGYYAIGVVGSGTQAANSFLSFSAHLQARNA